jgi:hypothetical protein
MYACIHNTRSVRGKEDRANHRDLLIDEEIFHPLDALQVQMVGRLVQEQDVGLSQQNLAEADPHFPPAAEGGYELLALLHREAHHVHDTLGARGQRRHALLVSRRLQLRHAVQHLSR